MNNKRFERRNVKHVIESATDYRLAVAIAGTEIACSLNDRPLIHYSAESLVQGHVGLWTKADSVTSFGSVRIERQGADNHEIGCA